MNMNQYWLQTVCFICGVFLGSGAMLWLMVEVYEGKPKPQPVVTATSPTAVSIDRLADIERRMALLEAQKEANTIRAEQRVMDMRTALDKLEKLKAKQDGQLSRQGEPLFTLAPPDTTAFVPRTSTPKVQDGYDLDEIRKMANELGVSKMVVK